jgi:NADPH2:quinone reductase
MRAAAYALSGPDAGRIQLRELPDPVPGPGEVRVRVAVSGVNPTDWKVRRSGQLIPLEAELIVPDQDGAGTIDAVGEGVEEARIGERVWLYNAQWQRPFGTAAEFVALPQHLAVPLPESASFELGASLGIPAITAHRCLFSAGPLTSGDRVLVHGGAGAVGHAAIELAAWRGAAVAATVSSPAKAAIAREAGAELVLDYTREDVAAAVQEWAPDGVVRIVELDLGANIAVDAEVIAPGGTISVYSVSGTVELQRRLMIRNAVVEFVLVYTIPDAAKRQAVADISDALAAGALTVLPLHRFALEDAQAAHDAVEAGAVGKVLIDVNAPRR